MYHIKYDLPHTQAKVHSPTVYLVSHILYITFCNDLIRISLVLDQYILAEEHLEEDIQ